MSTIRRPSSREDVLEGALELVRAGKPVSLDTAARAAGLTKPGLMYHFATKQTLMTALVDHVVDGYERELTDRLPKRGTATVEQRLGAYLDWALTAEMDCSDLVLFTDPRLREPLTARWVERMQAWIEVPADLPARRRARLLAVRLIADGSWFADASGVFPLGAGERRAVLSVARELLRGAL